MAVRADKRLAVEAARGACLAVHASAGLAWAVDAEAARALRAGEGLVRAAIARLLALGETASEEEKKGIRAEGGGEVDLPQASVRKRRRRRPVTSGSGGGGPSPAAGEGVSRSAARRRRRRLRVAAAAGGPPQATAAAGADVVLHSVVGGCYGGGGVALDAPATSGTAASPSARDGGDRGDVDGYLEGGELVDLGVDRPLVQEQQSTLVARQVAELVSSAGAAERRLLTMALGLSDDASGATVAQSLIQLKGKGTGQATARTSECVCGG